MNSIPEDVNNADLIFIGTPISIDDISPNEFLPFQDKYVFNVDEIIKNNGDSIKNEIIIFSEDSDYGCGAQITMHQKQIVFAQLADHEYFSYCANNIFETENKNALKLMYVRANFNSYGLISIRNIIIVLIILTLLLWYFKKFKIREKM